MTPMQDNALGTLVSQAVKSSTEHHALLVKAGINAVVFASKHGRCDFMNTLFNGISNQDGLAFKTFIRRLHEHVKGDAFSWSKKNGFTIAPTNDENDSKKARAAIDNMTAKALESIPWVSDDQKNATPVSLDAYLRSVIKRIESNHSDNTYASDVVKDLSTFADKIAKANQRAANAPANNDTEETPVEEAA